MNFVYLKVLFAEPKNELSILSSISFFLHYKSEVNKIFKNVLEFRQQICHWNALIVLGYWYISLLQSSFPINLNSFYIKIGEPFTKTSKLSTVSCPLSNLKCFPWNSFESRDSFCCINVKIEFYFFMSDYEILEKKQKWGTRIELHAKRQTGRVLYSLPKQMHIKVI